MFFHWQNLNDRTVPGTSRYREPEKGWPTEGRCWLHWGERSCLEFNWCLGRNFCHLQFHRGGERGSGISIAMPLVMISISVSTQKNWRSAEREIDLSIHDWAIWWKLWGDPWGWDSHTPRWRDGNFNLPDFVLGKTRFQKELIETKDVIVPMPEGPYPATAKLERCVWKRPRWFAKVRNNVWLEIVNGIPHEGKGENSWDCGEDGLFGIGGSSYEDAIANAVESVLTDRRRYNGNMQAVYPHPSRRPTPCSTSTSPSS